VTDSSSAGSPKPQLDESVPHSARVWNYWLGGKDFYPSDRAVGDQVMAMFPDITRLARADRAFLGRAVGFLAGEAGIRQYLDVGTGLPTANNTHQVAQSIAPASRVVYVDNDPLVLVHARALLTSTPEGKCDYLDADLRDTGKILEAARRTLDFSKPVAVMLIAVLHLISDADDPAGVIAQLMEAVPAGSTLAISHVPNDMHMGAMSDMSDRLNRLLSQPSTYRGQAQVTGFFTRLELVDPGVVPIQRWRPDTEEEAAAVAAMWGGVAVKR